MRYCMFSDFTDTITLKQRLALIKGAGFDGVMLGFSGGDRYEMFEEADKAGLEIENVHSSFDRMNALWTEREDSREIFERTIDCIDLCAENGVRKVVVHPTDGMIPPPVTELGLVRFERLVENAEKRGVTLLFENIQLPQFLEVLFDRVGGSENVGFCYDVGHESCFTPGAGCLKRYGDRLGGLHIHDNDGISDQHLIPYDGVIDYEPFLNDLSKLGYEGSLSLELYMTKSDRYLGADSERFVERAFSAASRLTELYNG